MVDRYLATHYEIVPVVTPAVGAELSYRAGGRYTDRIITVRFRFTASAVVANRFAKLVVDDGQTEIIRVSVDAIIAATGTMIVCGFSGAPRQPLSGGNALIPLPIEGLLLLPGWRLRTITDAIDVGDQYDQIAVTIQRYRTGPAMEQLPTLDVQETTR